MEKTDNIFLRDATCGLVAPCSISEIVPLVRPALRASSRCESPYAARRVASRSPTPSESCFGSLTVTYFFGLLLVFNYAELSLIGKL
jgi:hypothetical protein